MATANKKPREMVLDLDQLRFGGQCQMRTEIDEEHVQRIAESLDKDPASVPPINVLWDSKHYHVWDGNHRILAHQRIGKEKIRCIVEPGTARDAMLLAVGANAKHGLPRTAGDKRIAVTTLLADKQWGKRSDRWIADACRVSPTLVGRMRAEADKAQQPTAKADGQVSTWTPDAKPAAKREGRDGKAYSAPATSPEIDESYLLDGAKLGLRDELARKIRSTEAASSPQQVAKLARLDRQDPALAETVANMLAECEVTTVEQALAESDAVDDPEEEAADVLRQMLRKAQSVWRVSCPKKASPALGASVLEQVADEWLNGGWFS